MDDLRPNLEPGNADGHTVLRYLVEEKRLPLEVAIDRVYSAIAKYQHEFRSSQSKLILGSVVTGALSLPISLPLGLPSALVAGSIATAVYTWMELGTQRDRLKPEYVTLKQSHLLENFIKFLAVNLTHQQQQQYQQQQQAGQPFGMPSTVSEITTKTILAAYESTVMQVSQGDHLDTNASDPVLAIFVINLRSHTNFLPNWVMEALQSLEIAERQRRQHLEKANDYLFGDLSRQQWQLAPSPAPQMSIQSVRSDQGWEGEQRLGKTVEEIPPTSRTVGSNTRLNAVPASVTPVSEAAIAPDTQPQLYDIARDMGTYPQSTLIVGLPGAGKGVLVSNAIRHLKAVNPKMIVYGVDPKNDPKEAGYWQQGFDVVQRQNFDSSDYEQAIYWLMNCIEHFKQLLAPKLLVIDELTLIGQFFDLMESKSALKLFKAFIAAIASTGDSSGNHVWLLGQVANAEDLKFSGGFRSLLRAIALISPKNQAAVNALLSTRFVSIPKDGKAEIERLIEESPVGRAFFDGKTDRWYSMPELPNHSGYDRDSRQFLGSASGSQPERGSQPSERLNAGQGKQFIDGGSSSEPGSELSERSSGKAADPERRFTPKQFTRQQTLEVIQLLKDLRQNQQQIIEGLWEVTKGGSAAWQAARDEYKQITGE